MAECTPVEGTSIEYLHDLLQTPRRVSVDGVDASQRSASEVIALHKYIQQECVAGGISGGFKTLKRQVAVPPNSIGVHAGWHQENRRIW